MEGNKDLVDALTKYNNGRGLSSFIQKNQFVLCKKTLSPNLMLGLFEADEGIVANALHLPVSYDKNLNVYRHIAAVGTPQKNIKALEETGNERMLEMIREILDKSGLLEAGGDNEETSGGSGRTENESRGSSSGVRDERPVETTDSKPAGTTTILDHEPSQQFPSSSSLSPSGRPHDDDEDLFPEKAESYNCKNVRVLFINQKFDSVAKSGDKKYTKNKRDGADADDDHVKKLFENTLNMKLQTEQNVDSGDFPVILKRFKENCINDGNDGCIIIVSTHGADPHFLLMNDLKLIDLEKHVIQKFSRAEFPGFVGNPKIFLFNACRSEIASDSQSVEEDSAPLEYENILIGHSTVPYYKSRRHTKDGSHYIKFLRDVYMEDQEKKWEIRRLLHTVGRKVGEAADSKARVQIPELRDRLFDKNFYLAKNQK